MSKEMIISVNGREKKIAILDNGKVTEFYIERGNEENSGVVGNIYKGRVQRVLPGMQSAFVEIGLERDAFLYVSDFFDEEEEIERIIMEKGKKASPEDARREADERIERARVEREKQMESAQEIAEPLVEVEEVSEEETEEPKKTKGSEEVEAVAEQPKQRKNRRDRKREKKMLEAMQTGQEGGSSEEKSDDTTNELAEMLQAEDSDFERVIDDEDTGDMFKDAYMQEAIVDKVRAVEFEMESTAVAEVGSLIDSVTEEASGFERIADEEETETPEPKKSKSRRGKTSSRSKKKVAAKPQVTEEKTEEPAVIEEVKPEPPQKKKSTSRNKKSAVSKGPKTTAKEPAVEVKEEAAEVIEAVEEKPAKTKSARGKKTTSRGKRTTKKDAKLEDAEAGIKESSDTAQMAARRGGRGGRGRRGGTNRGTRGKTQERYENSEMGETVTAEGEIAKADFQGYNGGRERSQPTITDLLREGQEILVQIAKEPIARKGARITSHIALPGRFLVYMPTIEHVGVSRKIESASERGRLRTLIQKIRQNEDVPSGGFIVRTAGIGISDDDLAQDARYLVRTWLDIKKQAEKAKSPALVHQDLDIIQRLLRDQLSDDFTAIRVDSEEEYLRVVEFINRIQPRMVKRVKLYTREEPILEAFGVQEEIDKALKPRVWLKSGGYLVINQTEALVAIDVNTGKFVGKGNARLEDTITKTNMEAVEEISRQIRLRDLGGIIVLDLIDMEDRRNRQKVLAALQEHLSTDKSPTKVLSFNDFGLIIMTRKRVKQSLERTMCAPCEYCQGAGWVKSPQTVCYEILEEARRLSKSLEDVRQTTLRVNPEVAKALRDAESEVLDEIEAYLGAVDVTSDKSVHQEQFDFAFI